MTSTATGARPGPVAGLDWDNAILQATLPGSQPGARAPRRAALRPRLGEHSAAPRRIRTSSTTRSRSPALASTTTSAPQTPFIVSPDGSLITYFDDADSLARKVALVRNYGLAGIAAWRLGFEDPGFWSLFRA